MSHLWHFLIFVHIACVKIGILQRKHAPFRVYFWPPCGKGFSDKIFRKKMQNIDPQRISPPWDFQQRTKNIELGYSLGGLGAWLQYMWSGINDFIFAEMRIKCACSFIRVRSVGGRGADNYLGLKKGLAQPSPTNYTVGHSHGQNSSSDGLQLIHRKKNV